MVPLFLCFPKRRICISGVSSFAAPTRSQGCSFQSCLQWGAEGGTQHQGASWPTIRPSIPKAHMREAPSLLYIRSIVEGPFQQTTSCWEGRPHQPCCKQRIFGCGSFQSPEERLEYDFGGGRVSAKSRGVQGLVLVLCSGIFPADAGAYMGCQGLTPLASSIQPPSLPLQLTSQRVIIRSQIRERHLRLPTYLTMVL